MSAPDQMKNMQEQKEIETTLMEAFLVKMKRNHEEEISALQSQLEVIERDLSRIRMTTYSFKETGRADRVSLSKQNYNIQTAGRIGSSGIAQRDDARFQDIEELYFEACKIESIQRLDEISSVLYHTTQYNSFRELDTIFNADPFESISITSSIEFDRDNEYFAVAGVSRKIKIFDFEEIAHAIDRTEYIASDDSRSGQPLGIGSDVWHGKQRIHCPSLVINADARITCLSWNTCIKSHLASSDHGGLIKLWDTTNGCCIQTFDEHERRTWSVDVCPTEPMLIASGSDDATVRIWSTTMRQSALTLPQDFNVCSVKFAPTNSNYLAVGTAGQKVICYDLRYPEIPLRSFQDRMRAVSYVRWLNDMDLISASTDNSLRRWNMTTNDPCIIYRGHKNSKHFVGLSVKRDWISCGSEDNCVYAYHKDIKSPIAKFRFPSNGNAFQDSSTATNSEYRAFISSSCWKDDSNILLAANSKGILKVLKLDKQ